MRCGKGAREAAGSGAGAGRGAPVPGGSASCRRAGPTRGPGNQEAQPTWDPLGGPPGCDKAARAPSMPKGARGDPPGGRPPDTQTALGGALPRRSGPPAGPLGPPGVRVSLSNATGAPSVASTPGRGRSPGGAVVSSSAGSAQAGGPRREAGAGGLSPTPSLSSTSRGRPGWRQHPQASGSSRGGGGRKRGADRSERGRGGRPGSRGAGGRAGAHLPQPRREHSTAQSLSRPQRKVLF